MMAVWGADVAGLEAVAADLQRYADTVERARASIDAQLARTAWQGQNADTFRWRWRTVSARDLDGFRIDCLDTASDLRRQAQEQLDASSSTGRGGARGLGRSTQLVGGVIPGLHTSMLVNPGLALAAAGWLAPAVGVARDVFFPDLIGTADTLAGVGISYIETAAVPSLLPVNVMHGKLDLGLSKGHLLTNGANKGLLQTAGVGLSAGVAGITSGFSQWTSDIGTDVSTGEQVTRATSVAGVNAGVSFGVGVGVGAATALIPVVGPIAAPWTGKLAAAGTSWALEESGANEFIADVSLDLHGKAREGFDMMGDTVTDLGESAVGGARDLMRGTGEVLDDIGGGISDAVSGATRRFNPFSD